MDLTRSYHMAEYVGQDMTAEKLYALGKRFIQDIAAENPDRYNQSINHLWTYGDLYPIRGVTHNAKIVEMVIFAKIGNYLRDVALTRYQVDCSDPRCYMFLIPSLLRIEPVIYHIIPQLVEYSYTANPGKPDEGQIKSLLDRVLVLSTPALDFNWVPGDE